jgi:hypothetical protein
MYTIVNDVLEPEVLEKFRTHCRNSSYRSMKREDGSHMYYAPVPEDIDTLLLLSIEQAISRILHPIYAFIRLNTSRHDTEFRIHSDSKV